MYASLDKFVAEELMDGDNQWKTDDHGLQDAKKGIKFESFPPVLQLQLKRFDYDFARDTMVKVRVCVCLKCQRQSMAYMRACGCM